MNQTIRRVLSRSLAHSIGFLAIATLVRTRVLTAAVAAAASLLAVAPADAQTKRVFGVGEPASISELPGGPFRSALEALPPQARGRALGILKQSTVPVEDFDHMRADRRGNILYVDPSFEAAGTGEEAAPPAAITQTEVFQLHSKPGATNILYLDFDGHDLIDTAWNGYSGQSVLYMKPYSSDSDYSSFSTSELDRIAESWRRVAEDFSPFDVDVTTEEPPFTINQTTGRIEYGSNVGHILTTNQLDLNGYWVYKQGGCGCGGVAYYNGFGSSSLSPGLVFNTSMNGVSEAISHEFGHNLNLSHDGQSPGDGAYYRGHGSGAVSWAPIMGASYYVNMTQWSRGEYLNANNPQDDMAQISSLLFYESDDHEDLLFAEATPLVIVNNTDVDSLGRVSDPSWETFENKGVIEDWNDIDLFRMTIGVGTIDVTVTPAHHEVYLSGSRSNLDLEVTLLDNLGSVLQTSNPDLDIEASINFVVPAPGTYYLEITGVGRGDPLGDGYSDYASIGQYHIHGLVPLPVVVSQCSDGLDNDGDGLLDYPEDPGCSAPDDSSEQSPSLPCDDGLDNDADGLIDYPADLGCKDPTWGLENPQCSDGIDNDGDRKIDWDGGPAGSRLDRQCKKAPWKDEEARVKGRH